MHPAAPDRPPPAPPSPRRPLVLAGLAALAAVALVVVVLVAVSGRGDGAGEEDAGRVDESAGQALGSAIGTVPSNVGTAAQETTTSAPAAGPRSDLPPITIPATSSAPTTIPGSEPASVPGADGDLPLFAQLIVDVDPGGYQDLAVYLRQGQELQLLSLADDGIMTDIEVFAPDGSSEGSWQGGEPGVVNGLEWFGDEQLPATGTYVIRVIHTGGSDDRFVLGFFGDA
jgi:hypothetical protein